MPARRPKRTYDHRLVRLVQETGDPTIATRLGVPRSTAVGWVRRARTTVITAPAVETTNAELLARVARLEARLRRLMAALRILLALFRVVRPDLTQFRVPNGRDKARLLRAIERSQGVLGLGCVLRLAGLSPTRLARWRDAERACALDDVSSCPRTSPHRLTVDEVFAMREMATTSEFRHVPTFRLALLAQRLGRVVASPSAWHRLVRERGWRRPRGRIYPAAPRDGIRASRRDEIWHIDTSLLRLLDGTRVYLHAVIDNFSRRILAWRVAEHFETSVSAALLIEADAARDRGAAGVPMLLADAGVENRNRHVDALISAGRLRRVLARTEITYSNSIIEAFWRTLKHQWLYLNELSSATSVRRLVAFYVEEHNARIPHAAFDGQTPDEMYFDTGGRVPAQLAAGRVAARQRRLAVSRAARCGVCCA